MVDLKMEIPNFFILGAPKCGTTALARWLSEHPDVFMSPIKEPHYYSRDLNIQITRTRQDYERLFERVTSEHKAVGEASACYMYSNDAVPNILADTPAAKFIVCLRNPIDMAYSLHGQQLGATKEHIKDFSEAWAAQPERQRGENVSRFCEDPQLLLYGPTCRLGSQLERLYRRCDHNQVLVVFLEDIKEDAAGAYLQVLRFLGVPDDGRSDFPVVNAASELRMPMLARAINSSVRLSRRVGVPRMGTGTVAALNQINRRDSRRDGMTAEMRATLESYFSEEIATLGRLVGRDLGHWKTNV